MEGKGKSLFISKQSLWKLTTEKKLWRYQSFASDGGNGRERGSDCSFNPPPSTMGDWSSRCLTYALSSWMLLPAQDKSLRKSFSWMNILLPKKRIVNSRGRRNLFGEPRFFKLFISSNCCRLGRGFRRKEWINYIKGQGLHPNPTTVKRFKENIFKSCGFSFGKKQDWLYSIINL